MYLEATYPDYLEVIIDGPFMPTKLVPATPTVVEHYQLKEKTEWTPEEKVAVLKDAKAKADESLTDIYDRFLTPLNNLPLVGKVYDREDSNTKFLRALSEEWEIQTSIIRHQYDLDVITLDEVYGMHITHDLEVQQRRERKSNKGKSVTMKFNKVACVINYVGFTKLASDKINPDNGKTVKKFEKKAGLDVSYRDGNLGHTLGYGNLIIGKVAIENVALVEGLKHNLLSINQITDRGYRHGNIYEARLHESLEQEATCLIFKASVDESWNWHKKLSHLNFNSINELAKKELIRGFPNMLCSSDGLCDACQKSKQRRVSFKIKTEFSIYEPYHMLHLDLFGPVNIMSINKKSDNGTEFKNSKMEEFWKYKDIEQQFSAPSTTQQNGVVERKNRTLIEAGRTLLEEAKLPIYFWAEAVNTTCYTQNVTLINRHGVTLYQMLKEKKPSFKHLHVFGCKCFVLRTHTDQLGKFKSNADEGIFVGYSPSKAYRVFNLRTHTVVVSINISFDDKKILGFKKDTHQSLIFRRSTDDTNTIESSQSSSQSNADSTLEEHESSPNNSSKINPTNTWGASNGSDEAYNSGGASSSRRILPSARKWTKDHTPALIIGIPDNGVKTRSATQNECLYQNLLSKEEPKKLEDALKDEDWVMAMQEELNEFERNEVWKLVPRPKNRSIVGTKWVFRNKTDSDGTIIRNKARFVVKGYSQQEGIDYDETFAPVARLDKALYGLKQASRAWYETIAQFLLESGFKRGLQIKQTDNCIYINQSKYTRNLLKRFNMQESATASTLTTAIKLDPNEGTTVDVTTYRDPREPHLIAVKRIFRNLKGTVSLGLWYTREADFASCGYSDADFAGCKKDRKSTSGSYQFLGGRLVSWFSKKHKSISTSTAEAEFITVGSCCDQLLWMRNQLMDYGLSFSKIPIYCDNQSAIAMTGNPMQHSLTKHISIRHHFIKEHVMEGTIELHFVPFEQQLAGIFTKPLPEATFTKLVNELGMINWDK
ncbi:hypothetical protein AgCh_034658 [Apium graveolens]